MTAFVLASLVLGIAVLAGVLRPLWRSGPTAAVALGALVLATTGLLYVLVGTPRALDPAQLLPPATLAEAIARLEAELARNPDQAEGWQLLARAYQADGRDPDAARAFEQAVQRQPDDAELQVEAAQARAAVAEGRRFDETGIAMLERALELQPMHQRARWFLGIAQRQAGQPAAAAATWEPLLAVVDPRTSLTLREQINAARSEAGQPPLAPPADTTGPAITVRVDTAPAMAARIPQGATLFVIARPAGGPPMPVAVERVPATGFPREIVLDDADSLMPTQKLSQLAEVEVLARVSVSGEARAAAGDVESEPVLVKTNQVAPVAITLERVVE